MEDKFLFPELDKVGESTLDSISSADKFNQWMFETILPYSKGEILEIGSGIGNISKLFLKSNFNITLSDIRSSYCSTLLDKFKDEKSFKGVEQMDLTDSKFDEKFQSNFSNFDTVFALNVVEHIKDDRLAITNGLKLLKKGGHIIILVPSYQWLYNNFDKELEHYRRYNLSRLSKIFNPEKTEIIHKQYFNLMGIFGWFVSGKILGKKEIPSGQMSLYNKLVPVFKILDKLSLNKIGLSSIVVARKK